MKAQSLVNTSLQNCTYILGEVCSQAEFLQWCRIDLRPEFVASLSSSCPQLQSLRIGGLQDSAKIISKALEKQLPALTNAGISDGLESWEEAELGQNESQVSWLLLDMPGEM